MTNTHKNALKNINFVLPIPLIKFTDDNQNSKIFKPITNKYQAYPIILNMNSRIGNIEEKVQEITSETSVNIQF